MDARSTTDTLANLVEYLGALELPRAPTCSITDAHCGILASVHGALAFGGPCGPAGEHSTIRTLPVRRLCAAAYDLAARGFIAGWSAVSASATTWGEGRRVEAVASRREWKGGGACACFEYTLAMALMILAHGITTWGRRSLGSLNRKTCRGARSGHGRGGAHSILAVLLLWLCVADATGEDGQERVLLFNTRGLAVSTAASFAMYFAQAALLKLAFIITQIREKGIDAGVLLELICNGQQAKFLIR